MLTWLNWIKKIKVNQPNSVTWFIDNKVKQHTKNEKRKIGKKKQERIKINEDRNNNDTIQSASKRNARKNDKGV